jgi:hypothetical protein
MDLLDSLRQAPDAELYRRYSAIVTQGRRLAAKDEARYGFPNTPSISTPAH